MVCLLHKVKFQWFAWSTTILLIFSSPQSDGYEPSPMGTLGKKQQAITTIAGLHYSKRALFQHESVLLLNNNVSFSSYKENERFSGSRI